MIIGILLFLVFIGLAFLVYFKGNLKSPTKESMIMTSIEKRNHIKIVLKSAAKRNKSGYIRKTKKAKHRYEKLYSES